MPRKLRIEYAGATYHIISRGNHRKDLFTVGESGEAFELALFETVKRCGWELYAYVIMSNHYHLALRTPEPNLVAGMQWLQSTFATRFNCFTGERGQVFEGRYKSILVKENPSLGGLVDYIHLNPVRARMSRLPELEKHALSSFSRYMAGGAVETGLRREAMLNLHGLPNTPKGMVLYRNHLELADESNPLKHNELSKRYCRGWFIGSKEAKQELALELNHASNSIDSEGVKLKELNEYRWDQLVRKELARVGKIENDIQSSIKGALWKVEIAVKLRTLSTASNPWIAHRLAMGHPNYVSSLIRAAR
jgi:putative transposase